MSEVNVAKYSGEVLRRLINENYDTQEDFAYEFGLELRTVSRYINEEKLTNSVVIQQLAMHFKVPMREFFPEDA